MKNQLKVFYAHVIDFLKGSKIVFALGFVICIRFCIIFALNFVIFRLFEQTSSFFFLQQIDVVENL